jgi:response regulator RpfG family c-di-GMP phosphodiesterase
METDNDLIPFPDEDSLFLAAESTEETAPHSTRPWKIMIVDDDPEVHSITRLVLARYTFESSALEFLSAYNGEQARTMIRQHPDTALILLDVVMETEHAGLDVVRFIREEIHNTFVRIILRTGQPGQAPENTVVMEYDINDYKEKTELTAKKLFTTVTTAIRGYRDLRAIERSRVGLRQIIDSSASLLEFRSLKRFAAGLLTQFTAVFHLEESALYAHESGLAVVQQGEEYQVLAGTGDFCCATDKPLRDAVGADILALMNQAAREGHSVFSENHYIGFFRTRNNSCNLLLLRGQHHLTELDRDLLIAFESNIAAAFDNVYFNQETRNTQREILAILSEIVERRAPEESHQACQIGKIAQRIARKIGLSEHEAELLRLAAPLQNVGTIGLPDTLLRKTPPLSSDEMKTLKTHPSLGHTLLTQNKGDLLQLAATIALQHHENWDGTGYPQGLAGDKIDRMAQIAAISHAFVTQAQTEPGQSPKSPQELVQYFQAERGKTFDPALTDLLLESIQEFHQIVAG